MGIKHIQHVILQRKIKEITNMKKGPLINALRLKSSLLQSDNYFKTYLNYNHFAIPSKMGNVLCIYAILDLFTRQRAKY